MTYPSLALQRGAILFALATLAFPAGAATYTVDSPASLQAKIDAARAGDVIVVKAGRYETAAPLLVKCAGTADEPVTIKAASVGSVELAGTHGFSVAAPAAYVVIEGFTFTHAAGTNTIGFGANHVRFTRNIFHCTGEGAELDVAGDDAEVDRNEFRDKARLGNMLSATGKGSQVARRMHVHHNYFHDYANAHGNGAETIRLGRSFYSMSRGDALVEYNLFVRCTGENELITNKSGGNTYRYNTFLDSPGAQLTLRHGNDCVVYGNYFRGLDGLRVFGDRHRIYSNYFEGNKIGIDLGNGDGEVADGSQLTCHDRPDDCVIVFNTFVGNKTQYAMGGRKDGLGAKRTVFAYNLIVGEGAVAKMGGPHPGAVYRGNLLWQTGEVGEMPADGYTKADPKLARDAQGIMHLTAGSPAIDAGTGDYPFVNVDLDGQPRTGRLDIGADELSTARIVARLLTPADVGPASK